MLQRIQSWDAQMNVELLKEHFAESSNGFERKHKNEPKTMQIDVDAHTDALSVLKSVSAAETVTFCESFVAFAREPRALG